MPESEKVIICPICHLQSPDVQKEAFTSGDYEEYACARCGKYKISRTAEVIVCNQGVKLPFISAWIREKHEYGGERPFVTSDILNSFVSINPTRDDQVKVKQLLYYVNSKTKSLGQSVGIVDTFDFPIIWGYNEVELRAYFQHLIDEKMVEYADDGSFGNSFAYNVKITVKGRAFLSDKDSVSVMSSQWDGVNEYLKVASDNLKPLEGCAMYKNCAHSCREAIVALSDSVYEDGHGKYEIKPSNYSNALSKLELSAAVFFSGGKMKDIRGAAKRAINLASKFAHADSVEYFQARQCYACTCALIDVFDSQIKLKKASPQQDWPS
ncbi:hypothetical protein D0S45_03470 [Marinifilum sp. JC120]|nr:hypothetical protein D0S45_03470 [Marinifilum sp. JC120]